MEPVAATAAAHTPKVIELAIEETIEYVFTWRIQFTTPLKAFGQRNTFKIQPNQPVFVSKPRPIAKVLPAIRQRKRSDSTENDLKGDTLIESDKPFVTEEECPELTSVKTSEEECTELTSVQASEEECLELTSVKTSEEECPELTSVQTSEEECPELTSVKTSEEKEGNIVLAKTLPEEEERDLAVESNSLKLNETSTLLNENTSINEASNLNNKYCSSSKLDHKVPAKRQDNEKQTKDGVDPCDRHRDWIRNRVFHKESKNNFVCCSARKMECVNGDGCQMEEGIYGKDHKETCITDCLEEFLKGLHLGHLVDYFKTLGCMCVRDLRLLHMSEMEVIQLISRRRLLQHLDTLSLHHEAPPEECSLEAWLTWYGLTHISGFLTAIGVHSVGDLTYLNEDDIQLLKPVTRRRILACHKK